jgi:hypothetical protein
LFPPNLGSIDDAGNLPVPATEARAYAARTTPGKPDHVTLRRAFSTMQIRVQHGLSDPSEPRAALAELDTLLVR